MPSTNSEYQIPGSDDELDIVAPSLESPSEHTFVAQETTSPHPEKAEISHNDYKRTILFQQDLENGRKFTLDSTFFSYNNKPSLLKRNPAKRASVKDLTVRELVQNEYEMGIGMIQDFYPADGIIRSFYYSDAGEWIFDRVNTNKIKKVPNTVEPITRYTDRFIVEANSNGGSILKIEQTPDGGFIYPKPVGQELTSFFTLTRNYHDLAMRTLYKDTPKNGSQQDDTLAA